jgi:hypothetical protein
MTCYATINETEMALSKRDSTLRYLAFLCHEITGSRGHGRPGSLSIDSILETVAVEAYAQVLQASWRIVPARFFKPVVDPGPGMAVEGSSTHE